MAIKGKSTISQDIWGNIVASIYEAAFDAGKWKQALQIMGSPIGCHCMELGAIEDNVYSSHAHIDGVSQREMIELDKRLQDEIASGFNIKFDFLNNQMKHAGYWSDRNYVEERDMASHPYYQESFVIGLDVYHGGGFVLERSNQRLVNLVGFRSKKQGGFQKHEELYFNRLAPHVIRALELGRINRQKALSLARDNGLEKYQPGLMLVNHTGEIVEMNQKSTFICNNKDGVTDHYKHLVLADASAQCVLNSEIKELIYLPISLSTSPPRYITVSRPSGKPPYRIFVTPITNPIDRLYGYFGAIYIFEDHSVPINKENILKSRFQFTAAEIKLVLALCDGQSIKDFAQCNSISVETPRYHLKNIFLKTDTKRQAELVSKLHTLFYSVTT